MAEEGGEVLEPVWLGAIKPHLVRCKEGHENNPTPNNVVSKGQGICGRCAGNDPKEAERKFRERVAELGGEVLEPVWLGRDKPHRVRCAAGHDCNPRAGDVLNGQGPCQTCVGQDPEEAWRKFRERVAALGGVVLETSWLGVHTPHRIRCVEGHERPIMPSNVREGRGICRSCAGLDPEVTKRDFWERVAKLGGTVLESEWLGVHTPHLVRCKAGHEPTPRPASLQQGGGLCRFCKGSVWDVFYVVVDDENAHVKFGITSGDPRPRIKAHARSGFTRVVRLLEDVPGALHLERAVRAALQAAGSAPGTGP
ncbi:hypothetical protein ABZ845_31160 [Streptomyces sp. NPDC047022]|uniref:hypothetical protein n=1 Tax=Streptomyces sp. NPDC047022 TaxID=3155737 RepID=UPI0033EB5C2C